MLPIMSADFLYNLRRGIERDEIVPYFQPLVELRTGQLSGFEVLARSRHPERGMISPDQFIWVAEESGLIGPLGSLMLRRACRALAVRHVESALAALRDDVPPVREGQILQRYRRDIHAGIVEQQVEPPKNLPCPGE